MSFRFPLLKTGYYLLLLSLPIATSLFGQNSAEVLLEEGIDCFNSHDETAAALCFQKALNLAKAQDDAFLSSKAMLWLSECAYAKQDYAGTQALCLQAKALIDQSLLADTCRHYFTILQNLGVVNSYLGRIDLQRFYYSSALQFCRDNFPNDLDMRADAYSNMSAIYYRTFVLDSALAWFDSTLTITSKRSYPKLMSTVLLNKGKIYAYLHDYDKAIQYQKEALRISSNINERILGHSHLTDYYLVVDNKDKALFHLDSARALVRLTNKVNDQYYSMVELRACQLFAALKDSTQFHETLNRLLKYIPQEDENFVADRSKAYNWLATSKLHKNAFEEAITAAKQALEFDANQAHPQIMVESFQLLAEGLMGQGKYLESLEWIQKGLIAATPGFNKNDININPPISMIQNLEYGLPLLQSKMQCLVRWYEADGNQRHLEAATAVYRTADSLLMNNRQQMRNRLSRRALSAQFHPFHQQSIHLFYQLFESTKDTRWLQQAFRCSERGRALVISEVIIQEAAMQAAIPISLQEEEQALFDSIYYLRVLLQKSGEGGQIVKLRQNWQKALFALEQRWDQFLAKLEQDYPNYHQLKYTFPAIHIEKIQETLLASDELLLSFSEQDTIVYCIGISRDSSFFKKLSLGDPLNETIPKLKNSLLERSATYYPLAFQLYQELLAPLQEEWNGKKLLLIPDGQLWHLPFNALPTRQADRASKQHFLIEETSVRWLYAAHAALLQKSQKKEIKQQVLPYAWVGMAPFADPIDTVLEQQYQLANLPGSLNEIETISDQLSAYSTSTISNEEATKEDFLKHAQQAQILHLATHAMASHNDPLSSVIFFNKPNGSPPDHALLYTSELIPMQWPLELVVLSACYSHDGKIEGGEGIAGIARAFSLTGCSNILASRWPVNDAAGPQLMAKFYQQLKLLKGKNEAYTEAQRQYLNTADPLSLHPFYWAGFLHIGDDDPIYLTPANKHWIYITALLMVCMIAAIYAYRRNLLST